MTVAHKALLAEEHVSAGRLAFVAPMARDEFLRRPALDAIAEAILDRADGGWLALAAPAGFGKTQQALGFYHQRLAAGAAVAWIDVASLGGWDPLAAALAGLDAPPFTLFLDDVDSVMAPLERWLRHRPPGIAVVTTGRVAPASDGLIEADALRLDEADALSLFRRLAPGAQPDAAVAMALRDGWAPAINIAAAAIGWGGDPAEALLAPDGVLARYWQAEMPLPDGVRAVLGDLSVLDVDDAALAAVVTGRGDVAALIDEARRTTPFLRGRVVTELARHHLGPPPARAAMLHGRAADWLIAAGRDRDAVPHLIAADRKEQACELLDERLSLLVTGGDLQRALAWLERIGPALVAARPRLSLAAALAFATVGNRVEAERHLRYHKADARLVLEVMLASHRDDPEGALRLCALVGDRAGLPRAPRAILANCEAWIAQKQGAWSEERNEAHGATAAQGRDSKALFQAHCYKVYRAAQWHLDQGHAARAVAMLEPALARADADFGLLSVPSMLLAPSVAAALLQSGDAEAARRTLAHRPPVNERHIVPSAWSQAMIVTARLAADQQDHAEGLAILDCLETLAITREMPAIQAAALAERALLAATAGLPPAAPDREKLTRLYAGAAQLPISGPHIRMRALVAMALAAKAEGNAAADDMLREAEALAIALRKPIDAAECALLRGVGLDDPGLAAIDAADLAASARRLVPRRGREGAAAIALTAREREVLEHLALHQSNKVIARALGLGGETVKWHVANLLAKLDARDRTHVIERARAMGLLRFRYAGTPLSRVGQPLAHDA